MVENFIEACLKALKRRSVKEGGFAIFENGSYRTDATAWSIIALTVAGIEQEVVNWARWRLVKDQRQDGRICISPRHPNAFWPTSLAVMAWQGSKTFEDYHTRAIKFLLETSGFHYPQEQTPEVGHDTSILGWPWIGATHSWIEPTANSIQALKIAGYENHPRVDEAIKMMLDRQLPGGGWNYGNTYVFGNMLRPMPDTTGIALEALSGMTDRGSIQKSMIYLKEKLESLNSPRSTGWSILGLSAWQERPARCHEMLKRCWELQNKVGSYDSTILSLIILADLLPEGLSGLA